MSRKFTLASLALGALVFLLSACTPVEFSPDGKRIVFNWSVDGKSTGLYSMNTDGTQLEALPGGADGLMARWSPDGKTILFSDSHQNLKASDTGSFKLTPVGTNSTLAFAWKEDSRELAGLFSVAPGSMELRRYTWPSANLISTMPLPPGVTATANAHMTWLRGREELAFVGINREHRSQVYVVSDAGVQYPALGTGVIGLGQSVDGRKLIWAIPGPKIGERLLTFSEFDAASGVVRPVLYPAIVEPINSNPFRLPARVRTVEFAPDGAWVAIVVEQRPPAESGAESNELSDAVYVTRMDGSGGHLAQQVIARAGGDAPDMKEVLMPSWSHDGKRLAILKSGRSHTSITLYNADGTGKTMLSLPGRLTDAIAQRAQTYFARRDARK